MRDKNNKRNFKNQHHPRDLARRRGEDEAEDGEGLENTSFQGGKHLRSSAPDPGSTKSNAKIVAIGGDRSLTQEEKLKEYVVLIRRAHLLDSVPFATLAYQLYRIDARYNRELKADCISAGTDLARKGAANIGSFEMRDLACSMFALTELGAKCPEFFVEGARAASERMKTERIKPIDLFDLCYAVSSRNFLSSGIEGAQEVWHEFWSGAIVSIQESLNDFDIVQLSKLISALVFAERGAPNTSSFNNVIWRLSGRLTDAVANGLKDEGPNHLTETSDPYLIGLSAKAFTHANIDSPEVFNKLRSLTQKLLPVMELHTITEVIISFGRMNCCNQELSSEVRNEIEKQKVPPESGNYFARMAWSFAVADDQKSFDWAMRYVERLAPSSPWPYEDLSRLYIATEVMKRPMPQCLTRMANQMLDDFKSGAMHDSAKISVSEFQSEVETTLKALGVRFEHQVPIDRHFYSVDILIPDLAGQPTVIECNGARFHYVGRDPLKGYLGKTVLKNKSLEGCGFKVISIDSKSWAANRLAGSEKEWLSDLLVK